MKASTSNFFKAKNRKAKNRKSFRQGDIEDARVIREGRFSKVLNSDQGRRAVHGTGRLFTAGKYWVHVGFPGLLGGKLPWLKIGLALLAMYVVFKKEIRFTVNMKAAGKSLLQSAVPTEEMGLAQPVFFRAARQKTPLNERINRTPVLSGEQQDPTAFQQIDRAIRSVRLNSQAVKDYIKRFSKVAVQEQVKYGIPASVKMAQALLETEAGTDVQAIQAHNHFGSLTAENHASSAWQNWRYHSERLHQLLPEFCFQVTDYKKWARQLERFNGTADAHYAQKIIYLIEYHRLNVLDEQAGSVQ